MTSGLTALEDMQRVESPSVSDGEWERLLIDCSRQHRRLMFGLAFSIVREAEAAEDACQQSLMRLWEQRQRIRDRAGVTAWLSRVVVNEAIGVLRRRKTERRVLEHRGEPDSDNCPHRAAESRDLALHALDHVPEPARTVVVMRIMQGLSGNEVSALLNCSAAETSRRLHHGLELMRQFVKTQNIFHERC